MTCHPDAAQLDQLMLIKPQRSGSQPVFNVPLHTVDDGGSVDDAHMEALNKLLSKDAISITKGQVRPGAGLPARCQMLCIPRQHTSPATQSGLC